MTARVVLSASQRRQIARGRFVRVDLGCGSVLVGRVGRSWRAYDNLCRHRSLPLDLGADTPMSDDGHFLLCRQHGALYRLADGACVMGPCEGEKLTPVSIAESGDALLLGEDAQEPPRFPYVAIDVDVDDAEEAGAQLFELGATGVEERDTTTLARGAAGKVTLIGAFEHQDRARPAASMLPKEWSPRVEEIVGDTWRDEWKKHFEPFLLATGIVVAPPWRPRAASPGEEVVILEPGRAFGTGLHETTGLVAEVLVEQAPRFEGRGILDVGCGSGILSLVALMVGAGSARALDVDPEAVLVTRENAKRNGMQHRIVADETPVSAITDRYPTVVANIEATTLIELAPSLTRCVERGGLLVLSGILAPDAAPGQLDRVLEAFRGMRQGHEAPREEEVHRRGEWVVVVLGG